MSVQNSEETHQPGPEEGGGVSAKHPFACNLCTPRRHYSRIDHLARHHRSHTREKPFVCDVCGKDFARADLLRRHATNHSGVQGKGKKRLRQTTPSTLRVSQACTACAAAKLKCEEEKPCHRCRQRGVTCVAPAVEPKQSSHFESSVPPPADAEPIRAASPPAESGVPTVEAHALFDLNSTAQMLVNMHPLPMDEGSRHADQPNPSVGIRQDRQHDVDHYFTMPGLSESQIVQNIRRSPSQDRPRAPSSTVHSMEPNMAMFSDESSLADFLNDIMMPMTPSAVNPNMDGVGAWPQSYTTRDVLDFGVEKDFDFNDFSDLDLSAVVNIRDPRSFPQHGMIDDDSCPPSRPPEGEDFQSTEINKLGIEAYQKSYERSLWSRWAPTQAEHGTSEAINLSLPIKDVQASAMNASFDTRLCEKTLDHTSRDRIMAMLFSTCEPAVIPKIVSSFPPVELLDTLMQQYICVHMSQLNTWIHLPTFKPHQSRPELIGIIIAAGALRSSLPAVRRLGSAIQEAVRLALPKAFEQDNSMTRDLQMLQAYQIQLSTALWTGNKRKMEIAESSSLPAVTMMRRASRFRRSKLVQPAPELDDDDTVLEDKWLRWIENESWKRLAFQVMSHDAQTSISFLIPPVVSYGEMSLELPATLALWQAKDAVSWRENFRKFGVHSHKLPSLTQCVYDQSKMLEAQERVDMHLAIVVVLYRTWSLIWDYRQLSSAQKQQVHSDVGSNSPLISSSWHQELTRLLQNLRLTVVEWTTTNPVAILVHELLSLNLHVSFEDLQLLAGKEGAEDARRVVPLLQSWVNSREARQAIWHAGQVLRAAARLPLDTLRDFHAIALYHAGLALWAYGILLRGRLPSRKRSKLSVPLQQTPLQQPPEVIFLDGEETSESLRFIAIGRAEPAIRQWCKCTAAGTGLMGASGVVPDGDAEPVLLADPKVVMEVITGVMMQNVSEGSEAPPLVENLHHLMRDLGDAAGIVFRKR